MTIREFIEAYKDAQPWILDRPLAVKDIFSDRIEEADPELRGGCVLIVPNGKRLN